MKNRHLLQFNSLLKLLLVVLLFHACQEDLPKDAIFTFKGDLSVPIHAKQNLEFQALTDDLTSIQIKIGDSVVHTVQQPSKKKYTYSLHTDKCRIGAKKIAVVSTNLEGVVKSDERILRVLSDVKPKLLAYSIESVYPHNTANFTQGFEFSDHQLYESTGQNGGSRIAKIAIQSGDDIAEVKLDASHFGEGITILNDTIYQLTWTTNTCFLYDKNSLQLLQQNLSYYGEGWGICNDGTFIITSDGSERLHFRDPKTFSIVKTIEVYTHQQAVIRLNELEYIEGFIFANIWMTNNIAVIEAQSGRVLGVLDCTKLVRSGRGKVGDVLNGIAYNKSEEALYITGKYWEKTFKIKLQQDLTLLLD